MPPSRARMRAQLGQEVAGDRGVEAERLGLAADQHGGQRARQAGQPVAPSLAGRGDGGRVGAHQRQVELDAGCRAAGS